MHAQPQLPIWPIWVPWSRRTSAHANGQRTAAGEGSDGDAADGGGEDGGGEDGGGDGGGDEGGGRVGGDGQLGCDSISKPHSAAHPPAMPSKTRIEPARHTPAAPAVTPRSGAKVAAT